MLSLSSTYPNHPYPVTVYPTFNPLPHIPAVQPLAPWHSFRITAPLPYYPYPSNHMPLDLLHDPWHPTPCPVTPGTRYYGQPYLQAWLTHLPYNPSLILGLFSGLRSLEQSTFLLFIILSFYFFTPYMQHTGVRVTIIKMECIRVRGSKLCCCVRHPLCNYRLNTRRHNLFHKGNLNAFQLRHHIYIRNPILLQPKGHFSRLREYGNLTLSLL